ncbi:MAG: penicillin-binding protein 2 [Candidatus Peribacteraceae bacterium]|nr:penicillin-binding protein 2 [Candidatus Peribacteraceae bacterium]
MAYNPHRTQSETHKRRSLHRRMAIVTGALLVALLLIVSRLIELQIVRGGAFHSEAQRQHYGGVKLPARRGEILARDSRTGETNILATNITLDLVYVDPLITDDPPLVARTLANILLTEQVHDDCSHGHENCPREFMPFYASAFDPLVRQKILSSGELPEPIEAGAPLPPALLQLPTLTQARDALSADIQQRIAQQNVTFVPLKYGLTKTEMAAVRELDIPGVRVVEEQNLAYANPEEINQALVDSFARSLAQALGADSEIVQESLRSRRLRYVPVLRRVPRAVSLQILQTKTASARETLARVKAQTGKKEAGAEFKYPLRSIALISEHWRFYPDTTIGSHVIGFLNTKQEPQYGVERTYDPQLRGRAGTITAVSDPQGGQILRPEQAIEDPQDGDTVILTIDRTIQKELEATVQSAIERYQADSGQAIVMDPYTGKILAMVNAPLFDGNNYADVSAKEPVEITADKRKLIVVELFHPESNARVVKAYIDDVFTASGRTVLTEKTRTSLGELEKNYDLKDFTRYYLYIGENVRREIFPTADPIVWMKYRNNIGLGAYLNRTVQEIYEPGSVLKAVTMAIALDQGEVTPSDTYEDIGPVLVDEYKINNNDFKHYGKVTMTNCLEFSINTCMTSVSFKLGAKLFRGALDRFGFGKITGIELEDELPGELRPCGQACREWSRSLLATTSFGQGLSATPLQVVTAWAALANGGKLMRPIIIDSIVHPDGTVDTFQPRALEQVITPQASETITAMLTSAASRGFAKAGKVPGYRVAAKTGTSQIAGPGGKYESGTGSTIATFAGYAPIEHPRFVILVKIDRPKSVIHGATAAAPVFKEIAAFLFKYYGIPPDEK